MIIPIGFLGQSFSLIYSPHPANILSSYGEQSYLWLGCKAWHRALVSMVHPIVSAKHHFTFLAPRATTLVHEKVCCKKLLYSTSRTIAGVLAYRLKTLTSKKHRVKRWPQRQLVFLSCQEFFCGFCLSSDFSHCNV